ncbi:MULTISPECIES: ectoine hydroxylase [Marinobacter]|uniref:ectoine hydroxylase n=1 Tax=Marinobacter TaxID=2742 RepID=UPI001245908A|nr:MULTISPECIES: ectoine hydroxylase [Marinobacter]MBL3556460.1 ectoine hydroxylase [Marinobacter sp. JB05H06]
MLDRTDYYRTREENAGEMFSRIEPVVHSHGREREKGPLGRAQVDQYERDGFLWLDSFFPQEVVSSFFGELDEMAKDRDFCDREEVIMDTNREKIRSVFSMHELSPAFDRLTRDKLLLGMVSQLLGDDVYIHQSRINSKAGFSGNGFEWHSDFETWHSEDGMPEMRAVSASIMLTDNNPYNGPLMLIPGSQNSFIPCAGSTPERNWEQSLKKQSVGLPSREAVASLANKNGIQAPTGPAGSLLLFECNTLHASNRNMSPWPRANLFFVYNAVSNRLVRPFGRTEPRPERLAARQRTTPLVPHE